MQRVSICLILLLLGGCGKSLEKQIREQAQGLDGARLGKNQVRVRNVRQMGDSAVAEIQITTGVKLSRKQGEWVIEEIRIGDRRWEKVEHILAVVEKERRRSSLKQLEQISSAIERYANRQGSIPQVSDFPALLDRLTPSFLHPLIRMDAWQNPFFYRALSSVQYDLRSAGPDGKPYTPDDLIFAQP